MAEQNEALSSTFPPPPFYYKYFTKQNIDAKDGVGSFNGTVNGDDNTDQLKYLTPPSPPVESYSSFGDTWPVSLFYSIRVLLFF